MGLGITVPTQTMKACLPDSAARTRHKPQCEEVHMLQGDLRYILVTVTTSFTCETTPRPGGLAAAAAMDGAVEGVCLAGVEAEGRGAG